MPTLPNLLLVHPSAFDAGSKWLQLRAQSINAAAPKPKLETLEGGIAVIPIEGILEKDWGWPMDTRQMRSAIRQATDAADVSSILLKIYSPGGTVDGTQDLADDVARAASRKPTVAYIEDFGASAAYWVASQAKQVFANRTAEIGSIGTVAVAYDYSKMYEEAGVKTIVASTGDYKGAFAPGAPVTEAQIADLKARVEDLNEHFIKAVSSGRKVATAEIRKAATGQMFGATQAQAMGLIDGIKSLDQTIEMLQSVRRRNAVLRSHALRRKRMVAIGRGLA